MTDTPEWHQQAACRDMLDVFQRTFDPNRGRKLTRHERAALAVCATCPVRTQCLNTELDSMRAGVSSVGVFGGTTARQRSDMLRAAGWRRLPHIAHGTRAGYAMHQNRPDLFGPACPDCRSACREYAALYRADRSDT